MYYLPVEFSSSLMGKTCFVSRVKRDIQRNSDFPLFTLHQIVYKVLRNGERLNYYTNKLAGESTFANVENAVTSANGVPPDLTTVKKIYNQIRAHKNRYLDIRESHLGSNYLSSYQSQLGSELDWDDSMHTATWFLRNNTISSLYEFSFQNIILIKPELLDLPGNRNAKEFFNIWCEWIFTQTNWNVYSVDSKGYVTKFNNRELNDIKSNEPTFGSLLSF